MKTVVIDGRVLDPVGHGISKYLEGVLDELVAIESKFPELIQALDVASSSEVNFVLLLRNGYERVLPGVNWSVIRIDLSCYDPRSWWIIPQLLLKLRADFFFNPTFASYPWIPCAYLQVVHDLNHLRFGSLLQQLYYSVLLKRSVRIARLVWTVSQTVKQELAEWARIKSEGIYVRYNKIEPKSVEDHLIKEGVLKKFNVEKKRFFLAIDSTKPHKNIAFLKQEHLRYMLGGYDSPWVKEFRQISGGCQFPLVLVRGLTDSEFSVLLEEAAALCFPSRYEGFGRPPIEAALLGTFVLASDIAVHEEAKKWLQARNAIASERIKLVKL